MEAVFGVFLGRGGLYPGASWWLWLALVSSSCGFWRVLAPSCRPFEGVLASSSRGLGGCSCPVVFLTGVVWASLVEACLLEGRFVEAGFLGRSGAPGASGASWGRLGAFWGFLGLPKGIWGCWGLLEPPLGAC